MIKLLNLIMNIIIFHCFIVLDGFFQAGILSTFQKHRNSKHWQWKLLVGMEWTLSIIH